jgi:carbamoyltransferase
MKVLGINSYFHCSSACVVDNGRVLAAVQEERLTRRKLTSEFPFKSIEFCLSQAGTSLQEIDAITFPVDLAIYLEHFNRSQTSSLRYRGELGYAIADSLISMSDNSPSASEFVQSWVTDGKKSNLHFINHHLSHAAHSYFLSPFEEAAILTLDGFGEKACQMAGVGKGVEIIPQLWGDFPHSLGNLYATFTEFLGFRPSSEEWKVMGASSYGNPDRFYPLLTQLIRIDQGRVELDLSYFNFYLFHRPGWFTPKLSQLLKQPPRSRQEPITQVHFDIAAGLQKLTEESVFQIGTWLKKVSGQKNICLGGGVFQNSVLNGKFLERTGFENVYIPSAPDDSGTSIGSALYFLHRTLKQPKHNKVQYNYWGPSFENRKIEETLKLFKWPYEKLSNVENTAARILKDSHILGWFQGGVEFGDRALGNRSILGNSKDPAMKDIINARVKFREEFRPFAPSILKEKVSEYFVNSEATPFMEKVYQIKEGKRSEIPAVTHVDGSGRLQTVSVDQNPRYYKLIQEFEKLTGTPVVLNTSFNINNEPIVASPEDAIRTFSSCGMDFLIIGDFLLSKDKDAAKQYL